MFGCKFPFCLYLYICVCVSVLLTIFFNPYGYFGQAILSTYLTMFIVIIL